ncbi:MAG: hypothetical protein K8R99_01525 [Actinomycetia bacterium]|nr:hypothetical protein [Actinomycetes bacterium]
MSADDNDPKEAIAFLDAQPTTLRGLLAGITAGEVLRLDLFLAVAGGVGGWWAATYHPETLNSTTSLSVALVGVVVGAVIGGATIIAAFLSSSLLRKLRAIQEDPAKYLRPFLFTGLLGTIAALLCLFLNALPGAEANGLRTTTSAATGFFVVYALASLIPNLTNIIRFIRLLQEAAEVSDDF